jgi:hypothetical protein
MNERKTNTAMLDELLEALRLDLRDEMRLARTNARLVYLRDGYATASSCIRSPGLGAS